LEAKFGAHANIKKSDLYSARLEFNQVNEGGVNRFIKDKFNKSFIKLDKLGYLNGGGGKKTAGLVKKGKNLRDSDGFYCLMPVFVDNIRTDELVIVGIDSQKARELSEWIEGRLKDYCENIVKHYLGRVYGEQETLELPKGYGKKVVRLGIEDIRNYARNPIYPLVSCGDEPFFTMTGVRREGDWE